MENNVSIAQNEYIEDDLDKEFVMVIREIEERLDSVNKYHRLRIIAWVIN